MNYPSNQYHDRYASDGDRADEDHMNMEYPTTSDYGGRRSYYFAVSPEQQETNPIRRRGQEAMQSANMSRNYNWLSQDSHYSNPERNIARMPSNIPVAGWHSNVHHASNNHDTLLGVSGSLANSNSFSFPQRNVRNVNSPFSTSSPHLIEHLNEFNMRPRSVTGTYRNDDTSHQQWNSEEVCVAPLDVLRGRGPNISHHPGNVRFRLEVEKLKSQYNGCTNKKEKTNVSEELLRRVNYYGGRFLEKDSRGNWIIEDFATARKKCSQALREKR